MSLNSIGINYEWCLRSEQKKMNKTKKQNERDFLLSTDIAGEQVCF